MTLTDNDKNGLILAGLHQRTPFSIISISNTQLSIARYYGRMMFEGEAYTHIPETDSLVRLDVAAWLRRRDKIEQQRERSIREELQAELQQELAL